MSVRGLTLFSQAASPTFFDFFLFFPVFTLHRKGEDNKEADGEKEGEGGKDGRPGKVTVTFSRYVTVNLLGFV